MSTREYIIYYIVPRWAAQRNGNSPKGFVEIAGHQLHMQRGVQSNKYRRTTTRHIAEDNNLHSHGH